MCGIAGLVGKTGSNMAEKAVGRMIGALERRGPDGEGIESWPTATLGHRRLAIFDLSDSGRQPMLSPDGAIGLVFNGAIYNFRDLRRELISSGYEFKSHTDTEVLVHGYREWGLDALVARLRGMFAFALWDDRERKLFLVRDRLGVKPLLYAQRNGNLAFASTARALRAAGFADEINEQAVTEYLEFGFVTDDHSIYKGVSKVQAATIVEWTGGELGAREYWTPPAVSTSGAPTYEEAVEETERLFLRAVEKRLDADVPVGALLSGGVDSSLVCWAVSKLGGDIKAFTVGTPGDPWDETADACATAATLKLDHCVIELSPDETPDVTELVKAYGEPFACASALGMLSVSSAVRESAKVLLTGDGGDDVFLGYPEHRHYWRASRLSRVLPTGAAPAWGLARDLFPDSGPLRRVRSFLDYTTGGLGAAACVRDGLPMYKKNGLAGERLAALNVAQRAMPWSMESARSLLKEFLAYDRRTRFVGEYLTKVDGATMYHSLEARSPFLDQELWEFASTLPFEARLKGGRLKAVLREIARRQIGARVAYGRKRGFGIPVQRWMTGRWYDEVRETFRSAHLSRDGWINSEASLALLERAAGSGWAPNQLWYIFVLESWFRQEDSR
ncbi:MAG TPA: asparagine synthase (glutamine-hydrolyzing) [Blastocatellia bacterium]|nr:asparagine synthase (glutamine-hydrolyzing) [Blastocatellia bacterium]